jgi:hypothetical protein
LPAAAFHAGVPADFYAKPARFASEIDAGMIPGVTGEPLQKGVREGVCLDTPSLREFRRIANERSR